MQSRGQPFAWAMDHGGHHGRCYDDTRRSWMLITIESVKRIFFDSLLANNYWARGGGGILGTLQSHYNIICVFLIVYRDADKLITICRVSNNVLLGQAEFRRIQWNIHFEIKWIVAHLVPQRLKWATNYMKSHNCHSIMRLKVHGAHFPLTAFGRVRRRQTHIPHTYTQAEAPTHS